MSAPTQQPAQLPGPQFAWGVQMPLLHDSFIAHALQAWPPFPHAAGVVAITQSLPTQQPAQLPALHVTGVWHVRSFGWPCGMHCLPVAAQFVHAWPCLPHAVASLPMTHFVPSQQPPQFCGPHVGVPSQRPPPPGFERQIWAMIVQLSHAAPLSPHAWF
jgi:hypothetical protein